MIYEPREDTFLINSILIKLDEKNLLKDKKILELGCGNCFNSIFCAKSGANVYSTDINPEALEHGKKICQDSKIKINFILSDMFQNISEKNFDIIIFNPPYLISDSIEDITVDGLDAGRHFIDIFIDNFYKHLAQNGFALLIHTNYNNLNTTKDKLFKLGYKLEILKIEHYFFEELYVLKISKQK